MTICDWVSYGQSRQIGLPRMSNEMSCSRISMFSSGVSGRLGPPVVLSMGHGRFRGVDSLGSLPSGKRSNVVGQSSLGRVPLSAQI